MNDMKRAKARQRIARAIEHSFPRELSAFIDYIASHHGASTQHALHSAALRYARNNYNAVSEYAAQGGKSDG
jgi:hypothetical protein